MRVLEHLEPEKVFYYFEEICGIPHGSYDEKALSDYCAEFAKERNLEYHQDQSGNIIMIKEASQGYEDQVPMIIQGHLDMVCDKVPGCDLDFKKDGLNLKIDGDEIYAEGTTLGGDDGIAVAYALALLDDETIGHPRLEIVLTVCEEVGLIGADQIDLSVCRGRRLLNIDSELEGILTAGCAGGRRAEFVLPIEREHTEGVQYVLTVSGLKGGHSGMEIDKGRANANVLLGRFLMDLNKNMEVLLLNAEGGAKENVIPKDARAVILVPEALEPQLFSCRKIFQEKMQREYGTADGKITLTLTKEAQQFAGNTVKGSSLEKLLAAVNLLPNGVQAMSADLPGKVETSLNQGILSLQEDRFILNYSIRSSVQSAKEYLVEQFEMLAGLLGARVSYSGEYPAWPYARESALRDQCVRIYREQYGEDPAIDVIHAGLECGIIADKLPGLDCVSFGPDMKDIHTPRERLSISSSARVWEYLKRIVSERQ